MGLLMRVTHCPHLSRVDIDGVVDEDPSDGFLASWAGQRSFVSHVIMSVGQKAVWRQAGDRRVFACKKKNDEKLS